MALTNNLAIKRVLLARGAHPSPTKLIAATSRFLDFENKTLQMKQLSYRQEMIQDDDDHVEGNDEELAESNEELFARKHPRTK